MSTYATTKLWNLVATLDFAAELRGSGVTVNAVHPGVVRTRLGEDAPGVPGAEARRGWLSPEEGARGPLHLATAPELARTTGRFFNQSEEMTIRLPVDLEKAVVRKTIEALDHTSADAIDPFRGGLLPLPSRPFRNPR
jgi:NAD(P)-dependent dehydrogenase (short-subunit alcohol dehydrogenase family)